MFDPLGYRKSRQNYRNRTNTAEASLKGAIDFAREARESTGAGESSGIVIPDLLEPIYAYRAFAVNENGILSSPVASWARNRIFEPWKAHPAVCFGNQPYCAWNHLLHYRVLPGGQPETVPGENHSCGYYSVKSPSNTMGQHGEAYAIIAKVALWGKICEADKGYRSQYIYPVAFKMYTSILRDGNRWTAKEIGARVEQNYGAVYETGFKAFWNY